MTGWSNGGWDDGYIPDGAELAMAAEGQWPYTNPAVEAAAAAWQAQEEFDFNECQWVGLSPDGETICHNEADAGRYCTRHAAVARSYNYGEAVNSQ